MQSTSTSRLAVTDRSVDGWCQRWHHRRTRWQHPDRAVFDPGRYLVSEVEERPARNFVVAHHYAGTWPAATRRYGLLDRAPNEDDYPAPDPSALLSPGRLVGVAVLGVPMHPRVLLRPFPGLAPYTESLELVRFVLLDPVPANAESWFLSRAFRRAARTGIRGVVAFSDPVARYRGAEMTSPGHVGFVYQATNAAYVGRATARTLILLPDGSTLTSRSAAKLTGGEPGAAGVAARLSRLGAPPAHPQEHPRQ